MTDAVLVVLVAARLVVFGLGVAVALRGIRGYRRTGSRALLAFAVAFALISLDTLLAPAARVFLDARTVGVVSVAGEVVLFGTAFSLVLYALYRLT